MENLKKLYLSKYFIDPLADIILEYLRNEYVALIENVAVAIHDVTQIMKFINYSINKEEVKDLANYIRELSPEFKLDVDKIMDEEFVDKILKFELFDCAYKIDRKISLPIIDKNKDWEAPIFDFMDNLIK